MGAHIARKRFGQHFLTAVDVIDRIIRAIAPRPGERLSRALVQISNSVLVVVEEGSDLGAVGPCLAGEVGKPPW